MRPNGKTPAEKAAREIDYYAQYMFGYDVEVEEIVPGAEYLVEIWRRDAPRDDKGLIGRLHVYPDRIVGWDKMKRPELHYFVKEQSALLGEDQTFYDQPPPPYVRRVYTPEEEARMDREDEAAMRRYARGIIREEREAERAERAAAKATKRRQQRNLRPNDVYSPFHERLPGGRAAGMSPDEFDPVQLRLGTEHELEHTDDWGLAQEIAMDHLAESPDYYEHLDTQEEQLHALERYSFRSNPTLVVASGLLLRSRPETEHTSRLEEITPTGRPRIWRIVRNDQVERHAKEWADAHGIEPAPYEPNGAYYVWALSSANEPVEGPWGPMTLQSAKTFARIGATSGAHDRAVTRGRNPQGAGFSVDRVYAAGTGERKA